MTDDKKTAQIAAVDQTLTDEFGFEDVDTERVDLESLSEASVPGKNSTMPLPAVSQDQTASTEVPEDLLQQLREAHEEMVRNDAETVERNKKFQTLDIKLEAISDDPTGLTEELYPEVRFEAQIDDQGRITIPRKYMGVLHFGQKVAISVKGLPKKRDS